MRVLHVNTARSWRGGEQQVALLLRELEPQVEQRLLCVDGGPLRTTHSWPARTSCASRGDSSSHGNDPSVAAK